MMTEHGPANNKDDQSIKLWSEANFFLIGFGCFCVAGIFIFVLMLFIFGMAGPTPNITIRDIKLYAFNVSSTPTSTLTSNLQITISCRNTDNDTSIYFDKVGVYAFYRSKLIAPPTTIFPKYLDGGEAMLWFPCLNGTEVSLNPDLAVSLAQDVTAGAVLINVKAKGRLRYKNGLVMVHYMMEVNCPAYVTFGNKTIGNVVKDPFANGCDIYVHT